MDKGLLTQKQVFELYDAAVSLGLAQRRDALLAGWSPQARAALPITTIPGDQLHSDLMRLNAQPWEPEQKSLFEIWLETAHHLSKHNPRAMPFRSPPGIRHLKHLQQNAHRHPVLF